MQHIEKLGIKREVRNWITSTGRGKVQAVKHRCFCVFYFSGQGKSMNI